MTSPSSPRPTLTERMKRKFKTQIEKKLAKEEEIPPQNVFKDATTSSTSIAEEKENAEAIGKRRRRRRPVKDWARDHLAPLTAQEDKKLKPQLEDYVFTTRGKCMKDKMCETRHILIKAELSDDKTHLTESTRYTFVPEDLVQEGIPRASDLDQFLVVGYFVPEYSGDMERDVYRGLGTELPIDDMIEWKNESPPRLVGLRIPDVWKKPRTIDQISDAMKKDFRLCILAKDPHDVIHAYEMKDWIPSSDALQSLLFWKYEYRKTNSWTFTRISRMYSWCKLVRHKAAEIAYQKKEIEEQFSEQYGLDKI